MSIKSILFVFDGEEDEEPALELAMSLAVEQRARLNVLHVSQRPDVYGGLYGEAAAFSDDIIAAVEKRNKLMLDRARDATTRLASKNGLHFQISATRPELPCVHFSSVTGEEAEVVRRLGRLHDLIAVPKIDDVTQPALIPALFETARPVLMIPGRNRGGTEWRGKIASVGWDGGLASARALHAALPLIKLADKVHVIMVHGPRQPPTEEDKFGPLAFLTLHGIEAKLHTRPREGGSTGEMLLDEAMGLQSDYLVMGAYGHSMLREFILGGVTQYVTDSADFPVLLAH